MTKRIDFFIVGAQKAGTTSLFEYLRAQPEQIHLHLVKEVMDFSNPSLSLKLIEKNLPSYFKSYNSNSGIKGIADVRSLFMAEISAKNIYEHNPQAKIVVLLREPVERAISSFRFSIRNQLEEVLDLKKILQVEKYRIIQLPKTEQLSKTYFEVSRYSDQLTHFIRLFEGNIHYIVFDDLIKDPLGETKKTLAFLGIKDIDNINKEVFQQKFNVGGSVRNKSLARLFNRKNFLKQLYKYLPLSFRMRLRSAIVNPLLKRNYTSEKLKIEIPKSSVLELKNSFSPEVDKLQHLTKLNLKEKWGYT
jgi:hypothetical protein